MIATCNTCGVSSPLHELFAHDPQRKTYTCPACHTKQVSRSGRQLWLVVIAGLFAGHWLASAWPDYGIIYFVLIILWAVALLFLAIVFHELGHYLATRLLGGICPVVTFGEGTPLFTWRSTNTVWQVCTAPTLGLAYCAFPPNKRQPWRYIAMLAAGGAVNLIVAIVSFALSYAAPDSGNTMAGEALWFINGVINGLLAYCAFFLRPKRHAISSDGMQIRRIVRDRDDFFGATNRVYQFNIAQALMLREKHADLIDFIHSCEDYETSAVLCNLLGFAYSFNYQYSQLLRCSEKALDLLETSDDPLIATETARAYVKAMVKNNIAFALFCCNSPDCGRMLKEATAALSVAPWEPAIIGTHAAVQVRCGNAAAGVNILEQQIANARAERLSDHNLALSWFCLAEGYRKLNLSGKTEQALRRVRELDATVLQHFQPLTEPAADASGSPG